MNLLPTIVCAAATGGILWLTGRQFRQHRDMPDLISPRQLKLRLVSSGLLVALMWMLVFSSRILAGRPPKQMLFFWVGFMVILFGLMFVTMLDLRELRRLLRERQDKSFTRMMKRSPRNNGHE